MGSKHRPQAPGQLDDLTAKGLRQLGFADIVADQGREHRETFHQEDLRR